MNIPDTIDTFLDELVAPLIDSPSLTLTSTYWNGAKASIKQFIENRVKEAYDKGFVEGSLSKIKPLVVKNSVSIGDNLIDRK